MTIKQISLFQILFLTCTTILKYFLPHDKVSFFIHKFHLRLQNYLCQEQSVPSKSEMSLKFVKIHVTGAIRSLE